MSKPVIFATIILLIITLTIPTTAAAADHHLTWIPITDSGSLQISDDFEFSMESDSTRRILANNQKYISYGSLSKNNVPCSRRGASYYNCQRGGQANPYQRGCSSITRCRR